MKKVAVILIVFNVFLTVAIFGFKNHQHHKKHLVLSSSLQKAGFDLSIVPNAGIDPEYFEYQKRVVSSLVE